MMSAIKVHVSAEHRGQWEVELPERGTRVTCATLDEARSLALRYAVQEQPCDLVVRDAYDRVVQHEVIALSADA